MTLKSLLSHSVEAYAAIRADRRPADATLSDYFRARKYLGSNDRRFISQAVYDALRQDLAIEAFIHERLSSLSASGELSHALTMFFSLARKNGDDILAPTSELTSVSIETLARWRARFLAERENETDLARKHSFPEWATRKLREQFDEAELERLLASLNQEAPLALRANALRVSRDELREKLAAENVATTFGELSPDALLCDGRRRIFQTEAFKQGLCEIQDEGSQIISLLLNPKPKSVALDACAGGGGKTLHLATLMRNKGKVYAYEKYPKRFGNIRERIKRAGLQNIELLDGDEKLARFKAAFGGKVDYILIDAPCTGSGTLRRNPDLKRRLSPEAVSTRAKVQAQILDDYAPLLKPSGRLLYATCSIFREENEAQAEDFLRRNENFSLVPVSQVVEEIRINADLTRLRERLKGETFLKLFPHRDGCDGFFAAVFERRS
ncbi:MAG: RsmB/NOP family class I SAM-dependent RNA methyltransferase [Chloroherpetonaceae bacterium]|nr:RsmB/NOP family class I SAM-dependent RNA methyltransferase [Chloroherpetonaceae bacterium]MDW8437290.1 RsmB/NOP family class I SAM-dependent RNA methyltransferase [Chloroherpetonaceae bacterium]